MDSGEQVIWTGRGWLLVDNGSPKMSPEVGSKGRYRPYVGEGLLSPNRGLVTSFAKSYCTEYPSFARAIQKKWLGRNGKMPIPVIFMTDYLSGTQGFVTFEGTDGILWDIEWCAYLQSGRRLVLATGWPEFASHYYAKDGDLLLLEVVNPDHFRVQILPRESISVNRRNNIPTSSENTTERRYYAAVFCQSKKEKCFHYALGGYQFCMLHVLEDPSAPYKQCDFIPSNGERCTFAVSLSISDCRFCHIHSSTGMSESIFKEFVTEGNSGNGSMSKLLLSAIVAHKDSRVFESLNSQTPLATIVGDDSKEPLQNVGACAPIPFSKDVLVKEKHDTDHAMLDFSVGKQSIKKDSTNKKHSDFLNPIKINKKNRILGKCNANFPKDVKFSLLKGTSKLKCRSNKSAHTKYADKKWHIFSKRKHCKKMYFEKKGDKSFAKYKNSDSSCMRDSLTDADVSDKGPVDSTRTDLALIPSEVLESSIEDFLCVKVNNLHLTSPTDVGDPDPVRTGIELPLMEPERMDITLKTKERSESWSLREGKIDSMLNGRSSGCCDHVDHNNIVTNSTSCGSHSSPVSKDCSISLGCEVATQPSTPDDGGKETVQSPNIQDETCFDSSNPHEKYAIVYKKKQKPSKNAEVTGSALGTSMVQDVLQERGKKFNQKIDQGGKTTCKTTAATKSECMGRTSEHVPCIDIQQSSKIETDSFTSSVDAGDPLEEKLFQVTKPSDGDDLSKPMGSSGNNGTEPHYLGVRKKSSGRYEATIYDRHAKKKVYVGVFDSMVEAALARREKAIALASSSPNTPGVHRRRRARGVPNQCSSEFSRAQLATDGSMKQDLENIDTHGDDGSHNQIRRKRRNFKKLPSGKQNSIDSINCHQESSEPDVMQNGLPETKNPELHFSEKQPITGYEEGKNENPSTSIKKKKTTVSEDFKMPQSKKTRITRKTFDHGSNTRKQDFGLGFDDLYIESEYTRVYRTTSKRRAMQNRRNLAETVLENDTEKLNTDEEESRGPEIQKGSLPSKRSVQHEDNHDPTQNNDPVRSCLPADLSQNLLAEDATGVLKKGELDSLVNAVQQPETAN